MYWNVLQKVYPVKREIVDLFKAKLRSSGINTKGKNGNWREVSTEINKEVFFVTSMATQSLVLSLAAVLAFLY